jgi:hypothetical protein
MSPQWWFESQWSCLIEFRADCEDVICRIFSTPYSDVCGMLCTYHSCWCVHLLKCPWFEGSNITVTSGIVQLHILHNSPSYQVIKRLILEVMYHWITWYLVFRGWNLDQNWIKVVNEMDSQLPSMMSLILTRIVMYCLMRDSHLNVHTLHFWKEF